MVAFAPYVFEFESRPGFVFFSFSIIELFSGKNCRIYVFLLKLYQLSCRITDFFCVVSNFFIVAGGEIFSK